VGPGTRRVGPKANMAYTLTWDAHAGVGGYVERYHHQPHSGLNYRTPFEVREP